MKVIICDKLDINDSTFSVFACRTPHEELESLGWKTVDQKEINGILSEFLIKKFGELPLVILFWNSHHYETHDLIYKNIEDILAQKWIKCISMDDLHHHMFCRENLENLILKNFDYIFSTYAYTFGKFFSQVPLNRVISCPHNVNNKFMVEYNNNPANRILLSGCLGRVHYPFRHYVNKLSTLKDNGVQRYPIDILKSLSYKNPGHKNHGHAYIKYLNKYLVAITSASTSKLPYVVGKFFEIPASGALLLAEDIHVKVPLKEFGFIDGENYLSVTTNNIQERILFVTNPNNRETVDRIRKNGYDLVWRNHTLRDRAQMIDNFLTKELIKL